MGDVINMRERKTEQGLNIKIKLEDVSIKGWRVALGSALIALGSAIMGIRFNVE